VKLTEFTSTVEGNSSPKQGALISRRITPSGISLESNVGFQRKVGNSVVERFDKIEDWERFIYMERELTALNVYQSSLEKMVEEKTKELQQEYEKRVSIERDVARLERLNIIGQLAAGLGHEVRNSMTTIRGFLQLLQNKADLLKHKSYFDLMIEELDRANLIIQEFLSLTKNKPVDMKLQNLNDVLHNLFPLIQADAFNVGKQFIFEPGDIGELNFDLNEITQLVLNFARNGLEAMAQDGCLTISTFVDGQNIVLSVRDEGTGIKPEHVSKLGTPFFTTKENGTGMGIPSCYKIADRHNAKVQVKTCPKGTVFLVQFPQPNGMNITQ